MKINPFKRRELSFKENHKANPVITYLYLMLIIYKSIYLSGSFSKQQEKLKLI